MGSPDDGEDPVVDLERAVAGGVVLGHDGDGRVVLAEGGLPGERVSVRPHRRSEALVTGEVTAVIEPSPSRVEPPCPLVAQGCGGCDLQHAAREMQGAMAVEVVRDALAHIARFGPEALDALSVVRQESVEPRGYRTTLRVALDDGMPALRHRRSNEPVRIDTCMVAHPALAPVLAGGRFGSATEVTLRASDATGEVLAVVAPSCDEVSVPAGVRAIGLDELRAGGRAWIHEVVDGHRFRVSAESFFQSGPAPAAALGRAVRRAMGDVDPAGANVVDLYGGVGLLSVLIGARGGTLVERSAAAVSDARVNTADLGTKVIRVPVEKWRPSRADVVLADPARRGLRRAGVDAVTGTGAGRVVLVSCDPASMARDVALLGERGYRLEGVEVVDMFPHTHHVEAVCALVRDNGRGGP